MDRDQTSYRSELCSLLGNVILINAICRAQVISHPFKMIMACDNKSAIWKTFLDEEPTHGDASCDLLFAIRHQIETSPLKWKGKWVKGHQDDGNEHLDEWAIDNIEVDKVTGGYWRSSVRDIIPVAPVAEA